MTVPSPAVLVPVDLACGHERRVDKDIGSLTAAGVIDSLWCIRCSADKPVASTSEAVTP